MGRKKDERNLRKFTFNLSEENYIYLEKLCKNNSVKIGPLLDILLTYIRTNNNDMPLNIIKERKIALLESNVKEMEEMIKNLKNEI